MGGCGWVAAGHSSDWVLQAPHVWAIALMGGWHGNNRVVAGDRGPSNGRKTTRRLPPRANHKPSEKSLQATCRTTAR